MRYNRPVFGEEIQESVMNLKYDFTAIEKKWQTKWLGIADSDV